MKKKPFDFTKPILTVRGFSPPTIKERNERMGQWGFGLEVCPMFCREMLSRKLPIANKTRFREIAETICINGGLTKDGKFDTRIAFVDDTCLLHVITVPGDCACLGIDGNDLSFFQSHPDGPQSPLKYNPHNVDTMAQAYCQMAIMLEYISLAQFMDGKA